MDRMYSIEQAGEEFRCGAFSGCALGCSASDALDRMAREEGFVDYAAAVEEDPEMYADLAAKEKYPEPDDAGELDYDLTIEGDCIRVMGGIIHGGDRLMISAGKCPLTGRDKWDARLIFQNGYASPIYFSLGYGRDIYSVALTLAGRALKERGLDRKSYAEIVDMLTASKIKAA